MTDLLKHNIEQLFREKKPGNGVYWIDNHLYIEQSFGRTIFCKVTDTKVVRGAKAWPAMHVSLYKNRTALFLDPEPMVREIGKLVISFVKAEERAILAEYE